MSLHIHRINELTCADTDEITRRRGLVAPAGPRGGIKQRVIGALKRISVDPGFSEECRRSGHTLEWRFDFD